MRTDSSPIGRLLEEFLGMAYLGHPYGRPLVGYRSDLDNFTRAEAMELYAEYYVPSNIVIGLAGDVDPEEARELAEKYFGDWEPGPDPPIVRTVEPTQPGPPRIATRSSVSPIATGLTCGNSSLPKTMVRGIRTSSSPGNSNPSWISICRPSVATRVPLLPRT